jgi:hypothetical protein
MNINLLLLIFQIVKTEPNILVALKMIEIFYSIDQAVDVYDRS